MNRGHLNPHIPPTTPPGLLAPLLSSRFFKGTFANWGELFQLGKAVGMRSHIFLYGISHHNDCLILNPKNDLFQIFLFSLFKL